MRTGTYFIFAIAFLSACSDRARTVEGYTVVKGKSMGSVYEIAYDSAIDLKPRIEFTLGYYSYLFSTYDSASILSKFNRNAMLSTQDSISFVQSEPYFKTIDSVSRKINTESRGAFNPGLAALMNYWGFGENRKNPDEANPATIDSLKSLNFGYAVRFSGLRPLKQDQRQSLNFNAIAPGQAVDIIAGLFDSVYHLKNYYINISGEIRCKGNNGKDSYWPIKIEKPVFISSRSIEYCMVPLKNYALATSGNYRQFYMYKGKRYSHSIDPRSGFPSRNGMLSATILAPTAAEADGYATACMVMGLDEAIKMVNANPNLKAFFIYQKDDKMAHWSSPNLSFTLNKKL